MGQMHPDVVGWSAFAWLALPLFWAVVFAATQALGAAVRRLGSETPPPVQPIPVAIETESCDLAAQRDRPSAA